MIDSCCIHRRGFLSYTSVIVSMVAETEQIFCKYYNNIIYNITILLRINCIERAIQEKKLALRLNAAEGYAQKAI